jgi:hypothetical protein
MSARPTPLEITRLIKDGGPLTKHTSLAEDGSLRSDGSACITARGAAVRVPLRGVHGLAALIDGLASHEAMALGRLIPELPDHVEVTTKRAIAHQGDCDTDNRITRTADYIASRSDQPALALIDFDTKGMPAAVREQIETAGGFWPALVTVLPALEKTARVTRRSTSAGLFRTDTGETLAGSNGLHVHINPVIFVHGFAWTERIAEECEPDLGLSPLRLMSLQYTIRVLPGCSSSLQA